MQLEQVLLTGERAEQRVALVMRAMQLVQRDISAELSVEMLAEELGVSWSTLAHVFPGVAGETLWQFVKRLRLERAAYNLLRSPSASVMEIAIASGFTSQAAFTRAFGKAFGCSPARFRKKQYAHPLVAAPAGVHDDRAVGDARLRPIPWLAELLPVRIEQRAPVTLAFVRGRGEYEFGFIAGVLLNMLRGAWKHGLMQPAARFYGVMYEDPYLVSTGQVTYDACVSVPSDFEPVGPFGKLELPGGTWACVDCDGTVDRHFASWNTFAFQWLPDSNWTMSYPLVAQEYHLPGDLLYHPVQLIKAVMGRYSATELIPVTPGPVGALRPI